MSASSINRKVAEVEKAKKVERRNARNQQEAPVIVAPKIEQPVIIDSGPVKAKPAASKGFFKKKSKKSN